MPEIFEPLRLGKLDLPNRLVMAPMTRSRAFGGVVGELTVEYYTQRAGAGLIITEATQPCVIGQSDINTPGLHSLEQVEAWREVTDAVHDRGGQIFVQLQHAGRVGHPSLYPDGALPLAPSAISSGEQLHTLDGKLDRPTPQAMTLTDIIQAGEDFVSAARNAMDAGFDGVELHGGSGFLIHQFLSDNTNVRTDAYGGSIENRIRFAVEVVQAVSDAIGPDRLGIRITPAIAYNGMAESDSTELYTALVNALAPYGLAYLHLVETNNRGLTELIRSEWPGVLILNPHRTPEENPANADTAAAALRNGLADAVSLASLWLANPDLPARILAGGPFNQADPATFYGGDHRGYTDYPTSVTS